MKLALSAAALAVFAIASPAFAADKTDWYGALGYGAASVDGENLGVVTGRVGARMAGSPLGGELEVSAGTSDKNVGGGVTIKLDSQVAGFITAYAPTNGGNVDLFARLGYSTQTLKAKAGGASGSASDDGVAAGVGAQWFPKAGMNGLRGEYTYYQLHKTGDHYSVWALSYVRKF